MNSSLLMQRFFHHGGSFIIRALAKKQCKSNSDIDPEHVCHEHTWQQVLEKKSIASRSAEWEHRSDIWRSLFGG